MQSDTKVATSVSLTRELVERIDAQAVKDRRSRSMIVEMAIEIGLLELEKAKK